MGLAKDKTNEGNVALIRARYDAVNSRDYDRFQGFYADAVLWIDPGLSSPIRGPMAVRKRLEALTRAFPDLRWHLDRIFTQGELVCAEFTFTGTHRGKLEGPAGREVHPTGRAIQLQACGVYTVRDGKIFDSRIYFDLTSLAPHRPEFAEKGGI